MSEPYTADELTDNISDMLQGAYLDEGIHVHDVRRVGDELHVRVDDGTSFVVIVHSS